MAAFTMALWGWDFRLQACARGTLGCTLFHTLKDYENAAIDRALRPRRMATVHAALAPVRKDLGDLDAPQRMPDWDSQLHKLA